MFWFVDRKKLFAVRQNGKTPVVVLRNRKNELIAYAIPATIGRKADEADMYIYDPSVSRVHVKLDVYNGRLIAFDCNSTTGTVINGTRLTPNTPYYLDDNSVITIGKVKLKVYINFPMLQNCYKAQQMDNSSQNTLDQTVTLFGDQQDDTEQETTADDRPAEQQSSIILDDQISALFDDHTEVSLGYPAGSEDELIIEPEIETEDDTVKQSDTVEEEADDSSEELVLEPEIVLEDTVSEDTDSEEKPDIPDISDIQEDEEVSDEEVSDEEVPDEADDIDIMSYDEYAESDKTEIISSTNSNSDMMQLRWSNAEKGKEEIISILWMPFVIGRSNDRTDYIIDAKGISHRHFFIDNTGSDYYITDLNSTNGVFINGIRIKPMARRKIVPGDMITVGEREYTFERA